MDIIQRGIIALIKSSITGEACPIPEGFSLEDALPEMNRHQVLPLCYDGAVRCGIPKSDPVMKQLFLSYCQAMMRSEGQLKEIERISTVFDEQGIDYMPLKGCNMKKLYPRPELRVMGDADILIREEQRTDIERIMRDLGFENKQNSDHELVWYSPSLYLELHRRIMPTYNKDFYSYTGDGWNMAKPLRGHCYTMSPEDEYIYIFIHFLKHYRAGGIGLRHATDLWIFLRSHPELDMAYVESRFEQLKLLEFHGNVRRMLSVWFENAPEDAKSDFISTFIFSSGSFGVEKNRAMFNAVRDQHGDNRKTLAKLRYLLLVLFPPRNFLVNKFRVLDRHPWMLPVIWVYRPIYKLLFERRDIARQRKLINDMTKENVDDFLKAMEYVGLKY